MARELVMTSVEVEHEKDLVELQVEGYVYFSVDKSYGEDADGNRGESRTFVEEVQDVMAYKDDGEEYALTMAQKEKAEQALVDKFLDQ
jgi:hypothetical protein